MGDTLLWHAGRLVAAPLALMPCGGVIALLLAAWLELATLRVSAS